MIKLMLIVAPAEAYVIVPARKLIIALHHFAMGRDNIMAALSKFRDILRHFTIWLDQLIIDCCHAAFGLIFGGRRQQIEAINAVHPSLGTKANMLTTRIELFLAECEM